MGRRPQHESQRSSFPNVYSLGPWLSCVLPPQKKHHPPFESLEPFFFTTTSGLSLEYIGRPFYQNKSKYIYIYYISENSLSTSTHQATKQLPPPKKFNTVPLTDTSHRCQGHVAVELSMARLYLESQQPEEVPCRKRLENISRGVSVENSSIQKGK